MSKGGCLISPFASPRHFHITATATANGQPPSRSGPSPFASSIREGGTHIRSSFLISLFAPSSGRSFDTSCPGNSARLGAHFLAATAVLAARSFRCRYGGSDATAERAEPIGAVLRAATATPQSAAEQIFFPFCSPQNPRALA